VVYPSGPGNSATLVAAASPARRDLELASGSRSRLHTAVVAASLTSIFQRVILGVWLSLAGGPLRRRRAVRIDRGTPAERSTPLTIHFHQGDLPAGVDFGASVAVDSETLGLSLTRDPLCVVQLSAGDGHAHVVRLDRESYDCPNLKRLLADQSVLKILHFARFDVAMFMRWLGVTASPLFCTKIASKLVRTYTDRHGLKDVTKELLGIELSKQQQSSDWGAPDLSEAQLAYAASDVLHLHALMAKLETMLAREDRLELARACFAFLPTRAALDLAGWPEIDIFAHA
jgi:ribonuclease D